MLGDFAAGIPQHGEKFNGQHSKGIAQRDGDSR